MDRTTDHDPTERPILVLVCDDQTMVADALGAVIEREPDLEPIGCSGSMESAVSVLEHRAVDVAVVDSQLGDDRGVDVARWIRAHLPDTRTLILTEHDDDQQIVDAYESGASALVPKWVPASELVERIRDAHAGLRMIDSLTARAAVRRLRTADGPSIDGLSPVDLTILRMIADGSTDREIADVVHLNVQTIRNRVSRLLARYDKSNRTQLAVMIAKLAC